MVFDKYHDEDLYVCNIKMDLREAVWKDVNKIKAA
jgi:hypothetical protein